MNIITSTKTLQNIKNVGLVSKPQDTTLGGYCVEIAKALENYGAKLLFEEESAQRLGFDDGMDFDSLCEKSDFMIALGGDGTLISLCRRSFYFGKPVLGVYAGQLGFLTDIKAGAAADFIDKIFADEYRIDTRMMLEVNLHVQGEIKTLVAFNDVVFSREKLSGMTTVDAYVNNEIINSYYGDGLIVSTPTGSTAYNVSAGGPVVFPLTKALILTPVCAHSLTQRPLVLPVDFEVTFRSLDVDTMIIVDGQDTYSMGEVDAVSVKIAKNGAQLIHRKDRDYFAILKEKLHWGQE